MYQGSNIAGEGRWGGPPSWMLRDFETLFLRLILHLVAILGVFGFSFALGFFLVGLLHVIGRIYRRSQEHRSNQYTQKTFHRDPPL